MSPHVLKWDLKDYPGLTPLRSELKSQQINDSPSTRVSS